MHRVLLNDRTKENKIAAYYMEDASKLYELWKTNEESEERIERIEIPVTDYAIVLEDAIYDIEPRGNHIGQRGDIVDDHLPEHHSVDVRIDGVDRSLDIIRYDADVTMHTVEVQRVELTTGHPEIMQPA